MLETQRLLIRRPNASDLDAWTRYFSSERAAPLGAGPSAPAGLAWRIFAAFVGHWELNSCGPFTLVLKASNDPVGMIGPWHPPNWPEKEISWSIWDGEIEGKGLAYEGSLAIRSHVLGALGWATAVSYIAPLNTRSIALAERLGCVLDASAAAPDADTLVYRHPRPPQHRPT